jgi:hypothetical protein
VTGFIGEPLPGARIGTGYKIQVSTDFVGPLPVTAIWQILILGGPTFEKTVLQQQIPVQANQHELAFTLGDPRYPYQPSDGLGVDIAAGAAVRLLVVLQNQGTVIDQTSQQQVWDPTGRLFADPGLLAQGTGQGGFTSTDRQTLNTTADQTLVQLVSNSTGGHFLSGLADWLTLSHGTQFFRGPVILLSGRGSLDPTAVGAPWAFGGTFSWFTVPAELGYDDGLVPHYHRVLLELGIIYADGGTDLYTDRRVGYQDDGHFVEWPMLRVPERIDYWVFPGVVVAWQFMRGASGLGRVT